MLDWQLAELADPRKSNGVVWALLSGMDGIKRGYSGDLDPDEADRAAAGAVQLAALSKSCTNGTWNLTTVFADPDRLLVATCADGTYLAVKATADADLETLAYEIERMVQARGQNWETPVRGRS